MRKHPFITLFLAAIGAAIVLDLVGLGGCLGSWQECTR